MATTQITPDSNVVTAEIFIAAPPDRVFQALTDPKQMSQWWGEKGMYRITSTLFAGLQVILPGETAPSHHHTPAALRLIVEGEGAFTTVDGILAALETINANYPRHSAAARGIAEGYFRAESVLANLIDQVGI